MQVAADGYSGPLKISVCGPLTLAARIELSRTQNPALSDEGALADLTASLAEGVAALVRQVGERVPGATVLVQVDEPSLPAVLDGRIRTASGLNVVRALDETVASATLRAVLEAAGAYTVVHCCAAGLPFLFIRDTGARAVSFDLGWWDGGTRTRWRRWPRAGWGCWWGRCRRWWTARRRRARRGTRRRRW